MYNYYSARIPKLAFSCKNFKIAPNAYFLKIQNMIMYISYELFWHMPSKLQKNQVKLLKIANFVCKTGIDDKKLPKYASKNIFFQKFNINAKITHINIALNNI